MKRIILTVSILVLCLQGLYQNAEAQIGWRLDGNGGVGFNPQPVAGSFLGTRIAGFPLNFRTGGATLPFNRMFIADGGTTSTDGYVGIGNNAGIGLGFWQPTQRLHIHDQGSPPVGGVFAKWTNKNNLSKIS